MNHTLKPAADGYLIINPGVYKPGDTIFLSGKFKAVAIYKLVGSAEAPIKITNVPGEVLTIGDIDWAGGSWGHGLAMRGCRFIEVYGSTKESFKIIGSNSSKTDSNSYPVRTAYLNFMITEFSDNFKVHDLTIAHGGVGLLAKTDVSKTDSKSWFPNTYLENFEFYNLDIYNTYNEGMYIGHTAPYWNVNTGQPVYSGTIDPTTMKAPIKLRNVKVHHNYLHDIHNDAIQIAAADNVEVYDNEISNWAVKKDYNHNGGILIGGRVVNFEVYNNHVRDGWGEFMQIYADAGKAIVRNNLFVKNKLSGIGLRGGKGLVVEFLNNTVAFSGEHAFRINGTSGGTGKNRLAKNIIAQPGTGRFYYLENGGAMTDEDNKTFSTITDIPVMEGYGYKATVTPVPEPPAPVAKITITSNELAAFIKSLKAGTYEVSLGVDSLVKKVTVRVE